MNRIFTKTTSNTYTDFTSKLLYPGISTPDGRNLDFKPVTPQSMREIWPYLLTEKGRTTDFSYAGLLMWVSYFNYEYAILNDTLFIKGVVENDRNTPAFSLPLGKMTIADSIEMLRDYCDANDIALTFSAVPEYAMEIMKKYNPKSVEELTDWADYLYNAEKLATLSGKKYGKKRNHVNQFYSNYPAHSLLPLNASTLPLAVEVMNRFDLEGDDTPEARAERDMTRFMLAQMESDPGQCIGAILMAGDEPCAFTIGDVKGDTLFIHIEKALREYPGSYEAINKEFAAEMCRQFPQIKYINREDDAGDEGLRQAKQSYHPLTILRKYNIRF